jgi:hypothetical protein
VRATVRMQSTNQAPEDQEGTLIASNHEYEAQDGWVVSDDTSPHMPRTDRSRTHPPARHLRPRHGDQSWFKKALNGLSSLQLGCPHPVSLTAMYVALKTLEVEGMHPDVFRKCRVLPPNGPELWEDDEAVAKEVLGLMGSEDLSADGMYGLFAQLTIREATAVMWPIWVEDTVGTGWVLLVWQYWDAVESARPGGRGRPWPTPDAGRRKPRVKEVPPRYVVNLLIVDPHYDQVYAAEQDGQEDNTFRKRRTRIRRRLGEVLQLCNIILGPESSQIDKMLYVPGIDLRGGDLRYLQSKDLRGNILEGLDVGDFDNTKELDDTSGERCFATIRELLRRSDETLNDPHYNDTAATWAAILEKDLPRWLNPVLVRMEMLGINAWHAMACLRYRARVVFEVLPEHGEIPVLNGMKKRSFKTQDMMRRELLGQQRRFWQGYRPNRIWKRGLFKNAFVKDTRNSMPGPQRSPSQFRGRPLHRSSSTPAQREELMQRRTASLESRERQQRQARALQQDTDERKGEDADNDDDDIDG